MPLFNIAFFMSLQIEYEIDEIQLNYLQLLSNHAQQIFTFRCKNSVAWYDERARSFKKAVKFEGVNGHEFSTNSKSKKAMIKVPYDGCKVISISTLQNCSVAFIPILTHQGFIHRLES